MPLFAIPFPAIDPVAISLGPVRDPLVRARLYRRAADRLALLPRARRAGRRTCVGRKDVDDFLVWATLGVVLGGRIGYVLFYNPDYYLDHPIEALYSGMAGCRSTAARSA